MVEVIIHIGMHGTGDRVLSDALVASADHLQREGIHHLPDHDVPVLSAQDQIAAADALADDMVGAGHRQFVIANSTYFRRIEELQPFFHRLGQRVSLRILIWMRPIRSWLDFHDRQGGTLGDPESGHGPFEMSALICSYAPLHRWAALFGSAVTVRPFHETTDIVAEFGALTGITLITASDHPHMTLMAEYTAVLAHVSHVAGFDVTAPVEDDGRNLAESSGQIALFQRRLNAAERRYDAVAMQLRKLTQPQLHEIRDRLRLAIALDDPEMLYSAAAVTAEIQRLRDRVAELTGELEDRDRDWRRLAIALDDPEMPRSSAAVTAKFQRLRDEFANMIEDRDRLRQRETELISSTSWRITAPLRTVSRVLRRRDG